MLTLAVISHFSQKTFKGTSDLIVLQFCRRYPSQRWYLYLSAAGEISVLWNTLVISFAENRRPWKNSTLCKCFFFHRSKSCLLTAYFYVDEYSLMEMAHTQGHNKVHNFLVHELPFTLNLTYHLFIYDCFTAQFQFLMHIPEKLSEIKP